MITALDTLLLMLMLTQGMTLGIIYILIDFKLERFIRAQGEKKKDEYTQ